MYVCMNVYVITKVIVIFTYIPPYIGGRLSDNQGFLKQLPKYIHSYIHLHSDDRVGHNLSKAVMDHINVYQCMHAYTYIHTRTCIIIFHAFLQYSICCAGY